MRRTRGTWFETLSATACQGFVDKNNNGWIIAIAPFIKENHLKGGKQLSMFKHYYFKLHNLS